MNDKKAKLGFWKRFFIGLGIVFTVLIVLVIIVIIYMIIRKPFGVDVTTLPGVIFGTSETTESSYDHPSLTAEQEIFLESIGVDTTTLSTSITAGQEACAVEKLGQKRVDEIKAGAELKTSDYLKAGSCFQ